MRLFKIKEYFSPDQFKAIICPRIQLGIYGSNPAGPADTFFTIKQKSNNEHMEKSSFKKLKYDCTDKKLSVRDECYKILITEFGKLSKPISW